MLFIREAEPITFSFALHFYTRMQTQPHNFCRDSIALNSLSVFFRHLTDDHHHPNLLPLTKWVQMLFRSPHRVRRRDKFENRWTQKKTHTARLRVLVAPENEFFNNFGKKYGLSRYPICVGHGSCDDDRGATAVERSMN